MIDPRGALWRYTLQYRRDDTPTRVTFSLAVLARDPDEARVQAKVLDPHFLATVAGGVRREPAKEGAEG